MTVDQMREGLIAAYSGDRWKRKVWSMRDEQVIAVYKSVRSRGVKRKDGRKKMEPGIKRAVQISIFDMA